jgi:hypothetical protein
MRRLHTDGVYEGIKGADLPPKTRACILPVDAASSCINRECKDKVGYDYVSHTEDITLPWANSRLLREIG